jgi:hypothetical protein
VVPSARLATTLGLKSSQPFEPGSAPGALRVFGATRESFYNDTGAATPTTYTHSQPRLHAAASDPWSVLNRHGWSKFSRRGHGESVVGPEHLQCILHEAQVIVVAAISPAPSS